MNTKLLIPILLSACSLLAGCGGSTSTQPGVADGLSVDLEFPDSLTGGPALTSLKLAHRLTPSTNAQRTSTGEPCAYLGVNNEEDIFTNGYHTTRFLISTMATWTCIADVLIDIADVVPHDGGIHETDNDTQASGYDPEDPTHFSITDDSDTQTTVRLYYAFDRAAPPTELDSAQFYISWVETDPDRVEGRMILDGAAIDASDRQADDPVRMRMDFEFDVNAKQADMFLQFDDNNPWAEGMRIDVHKNLDANLLSQVFTARGLIKMTAQFFEAPGIDEIPDIRVFSVADGFGNGAAISEVRDMALPLIINPFLNNHLGNYLFSKQDTYFFEDDMDWDYINKQFSTVAYRGGRTTAVSGGSWLPFNPSLDMIINALSLDPGYFSGSACAAINDECEELFNAVFTNGFADQEQNQGSDPNDWRSTALASATHLDTVYPNGVDWEGAFDQVFASAP